MIKARDPVTIVTQLLIGECLERYAEPTVTRNARSNAVRQRAYRARKAAK